MLSNRNVVAWLLLVTAVGLHILDEALTDFLPFYNQLVMDFRQRLGFFPMPTFSFEGWLSGLILAVVAGYLLTPIVDRGGKFIQVSTTIVAVLMIVNASGHLLGSLFLGRVLPGMISSPLLLIAACYVVIRGVGGVWQTKPYTVSDSDN